MIDSPVIFVCRNEYFKILIAYVLATMKLHTCTHTHVHVLLFILKYCFVLSYFTVETFPSTTVSEIVTVT